MSRKPEVIRAIHCMPRQRCEPQIRGGQGRFPALLRQDRAFPRGACVVDQFADLEKLEAALRSAEVSYDDESAAAGECHGAPLRASPRPRRAVCRSPRYLSLRLLPILERLPSSSSSSSSSPNSSVSGHWKEHRLSSPRLSGHCLCLVSPLRGCDTATLPLSCVPTALKAEDTTSACSHLALPCASGGTGIAVGSRAHLQDDAVAQRSCFRTILMKGFHVFVNVVSGIQGVQDTQVRPVYLPFVAVPGATLSFLCLSSWFHAVASLPFVGMEGVQDTHVTDAGLRAPCRNLPHYRDDRPWLLHRHVVSLVRLCLPLRSQCGFKLFNRAAARAVFPAQVRPVFLPFEPCCRFSAFPVLFHTVASLSSVPIPRCPTHWTRPGHG